MRSLLRGIGFADHLTQGAVYGLSDIGPFAYERVEIRLSQAKEVRSFCGNNARGPRLGVEQRELSEKLMLA
jgi:hypothetical protein